MHHLLLNSLYIDLLTGIGNGAANPVSEEAADVASNARLSEQAEAASRAVLRAVLHGAAVQVHSAAHYRVSVLALLRRSPRWSAAARVAVRQGRFRRGHASRRHRRDWRASGTSRSPEQIAGSGVDR